MERKKKTANSENAEANPHIYGAGTRLSDAYTMGRDGQPCPRYCAEKTSAAYKAWKRGRDEWAANDRRPPAQK